MAILEKNIRKPIEAKPDFAYEPLDKSTDCLRLLYFEEDCDGSGDICCNLIHVSFAKKPEYDALSYSWGELSDEAHIIFIDGRPFVVRDNLFQALKYFAACRYYRDPEDTLLLWVDAICIEQQNLHERSKQVEMMDFGYTRAFCVVVWLGYGEPTSFWRDDDDGAKADIGGRRELDLFKNILEKALDNSRIRPRESFGVLCGRETTLRSSILSSRKLSIGSRVIIGCVHPVGQPIYDLSKQRKERYKPSNQLESLLEKFQYAECREPQDKIFGFLGLAHDCHGSSLQADYTKPICDLLVDVLVHFCQSGGLQASILCATNHIAAFGKG